MCVWGQASIFGISRCWNAKFLPTCEIFSADQIKHESQWSESEGMIHLERKGTAKPNLQLYIYFDRKKDWISGGTTWKWYNFDATVTGLYNNNNLSKIHE